MSFTNWDTSYSLLVEQRKNDFGKNESIAIAALHEVKLDVIHELFVYTNIIAPVLIGDTYARLLRQVEIPNNVTFGDQCVIKYQTPYYRPLLYSDEIPSIEIDIRDDTNKPIEFAFGRVIVTLHFQKNNGLYRQLLR